MTLFPICCPPTLRALQQEGKIPYLGEVGTEEFLMKLTSQITEMVSAKITQGKSVIDRFVYSIKKNLTIKGGQNRDKDSFIQCEIINYFVIRHAAS